MNSISSILRVDSCTDFQLPECKLSEPENSKEIALQRVLRHREAIVKVNPVKEKENIDGDRPGISPEIASFPWEVCGRRDPGNQDHQTFSATF